MLYSVFSVPARGSPEAVEELNRFLRGHRVLSVTKELVVDHTGACWSFCIEYSASPAEDAKAIAARVDYRAILSEADFKVYSQLRALRKELAEKERLPPYAVFTNEQLAEMVRLKARSAEAIEGISGVGQARTAKYGEAFVALLKEALGPCDVPAA